MLHKARTMENSLGPVADPKLLEQHADYKKYSPIALCASLQKLYSELLKSNSWPALESSIPEGNNAPASDRQEEDSSTQGGSPGYNRRRQDNGRGSPGNTPLLLPFSTWKYLKPADENQCIEVNDTRFYWCGKCHCRKTGKVGFYNKTHSTLQHRQGGNRNSNRNQDSDSRSSGGNRGDDDDAAHLSPVEEKSDKGEKKQEEEAPLDPDPNGFEFQGAFFHADGDIDPDQEQGLRLSEVTKEEEDREILDEPLPPPTLVPNVNEDVQEEMEPSSRAGMVPVSFPTDPLMMASLQLALSTVANEMEGDGFYVETSIAGPSFLLPQAEVPLGLDMPSPPTVEWVNSSPTPSTLNDNRVSRAMMALSAVSEPRDPNWPSNVIAHLPGMTLYQMSEGPCLIFKDIHTPAHCDYCGRLGDWRTTCQGCGRGICDLSDDSVYSTNQLRVHWDSDADTDDFVETDADSAADEEEEQELDSVSNDNNNASTVYYSYHSHYWNFLMTLALSTIAFFNSFNSGIKALYTTVCWSFSSCLLLFMASLFWDTIYLYLDPCSPIQPHRSRALRRALKQQRSHLPLFRAYSRSWVMLSFFMLAWKSQQTPYSSHIMAIQQTGQQAIQLHNLLDITPSLHYQYSIY